jgi:hypothetical protein
MVKTGEYIYFFLGKRLCLAGGPKSSLEVRCAWRDTARMSRFGMGFGKDLPEHLLKHRPAVAIHSARCQQVVQCFRPHVPQMLHKPESSQADRGRTICH